MGMGLGMGMWLGMGMGLWKGMERQLGWWVR